jgi:hypothetical protein
MSDDVERNDIGDGERNKELSSMSSSSETVVLDFVEFVRSYERGGGSRQR